MRAKGIRSGLIVTLLLAVFSLVQTQSQELGTITFANSGAPGAQAAFLEGVKELHSFQFDEAATAFKKAQSVDPGFALAYWGEAMSYNHPLWAQQDTEAAKKVLEKLAPTLDGRLAKAPTPKEKAYLQATEQLFYSPGDKLARDNAYSEQMARMYDQWPNDHEVATFYALSLLGTVRPADKGFRRQALAASIVEKVFQENPNHPGAAHFIIHSFDDPDHAILALPAARSYAKIAPAAPHALHMPSHIFVQLGMWEDVAKSNTVAFKAARDVQTRLKLPEGREDFHTLSWLSYANLMMGKFDEAKQDVELARQAVERNPGNAGVKNGYLGMRARYILETAQWEKIPVESQTAGGDAHAAMPGMASMPGMGGGYSGSATWTFIAGYSAAKLGDKATADQAEAELKKIRERLEADGKSYDAKSIAIMEKEVGAISRLAAGQKDEAVQLAKEANDVELTMAAPSGPPDPIKPAPELYGEVLLEAGRASEAVNAFEQSLLRTPKRTPSIQGLTRAAAKAGTAATSGK